MTNKFKITSFGSSDLIAYFSKGFLLPACLPQDRSKPCMVIDLDETLVHSSFKVNWEVLKLTLSLILLLNVNIYVYSQSAMQTL